MTKKTKKKVNPLNKVRLNYYEDPDVARFLMELPGKQMSEYIRKATRKYKKLISL